MNRTLIEQQLLPIKHLSRHRLTPGQWVLMCVNEEVEPNVKEDRLYYGLIVKPDPAYGCSINLSVQRYDGFQLPTNDPTVLMYRTFTLERYDVTTGKLLGFTWDEDHQRTVESDEHTYDSHKVLGLLKTQPQPYQHPKATEEAKSYYPVPAWLEAMNRTQSRFEDMYKQWEAAQLSNHLPMRVGIDKAEDGTESKTGYGVVYPRKMKNPKKVLVWHEDGYIYPVYLEQVPNDYIPLNLFLSHKALESLRVDVKVKDEEAFDAIVQQAQRPEQAEEASEEDKPGEDAQ